MDGDEEEEKNEDPDAAISGYSDFPKPCLPLLAVKTPPKEPA